MNAIARRRPVDMLSSTIIVTTEPGLVNATARPKPAATGITVATSASGDRGVLHGRVEPTARASRGSLSSRGCDRSRSLSRRGEALLGQREEAGDLKVELLDRAGPDDAGRHCVDESRPQVAEIPGA